MAAGHEPVDGPADVVAVLALADGAAFHEQGHAGQAGHGQRVLAAERLPVAVLALGLGQPVEALADAGLELGRDLVGAGLVAAGAEADQGQSAQADGPGVQRLAPRRAALLVGGTHVVGSFSGNAKPPAAARTFVDDPGRAF